MFKRFFGCDKKLFSEQKIGDYENMIYEYFLTQNKLNEKRTRIIELCINATNQEDFQDNLLEFLQGANNIKLLEILKNLRSNKLNFDEVQKTIKLLNTPEKILVLLLLKESLDDFMEYAQAYIAPNEAVIISLFFGLRDGYKKAFNQAKHNKILQNKISNLMCAFAWQKKGIRIADFKNQKEPFSLFELAQNYMK